MMVGLIMLVQGSPFFTNSHFFKERNKACCVLRVRAQWILDTTRYQRPKLLRDDFDNINMIISVSHSSSHCVIDDEPVVSFVHDGDLKHWTYLLGPSHCNDSNFTTSVHGTLLKFIIGS